MWQSLLSFFIYLGITIMLVTNKQLNNLPYNDVKNLTFYFELQQSSKALFF